METGLTKNQIIQALAKSTHGDLKQFLPIAVQASQQDPQFLAHLIAWNFEKGQVRDSKVALPVASLNPLSPHLALRDNSLAHIALLDPRLFLQALNFARDNPDWKKMKRPLDKLVRQYLRHREQKWPLWERATLQHFETMKTLYGRWKVKPSTPLVGQILFERNYPKGSVFEAVANLSKMGDVEAAGTILNKHIPFMIACSALGARTKNESIGLALLDSMSPTEVVTNLSLLEKFGVTKVPSLRAKLDEILALVAASKKNILKAGHKAREVSDEKLKAKVEQAAAKQLQDFKVDGDWLVFGDCSSSMQTAIEAAKLIAATLTSFVRGKVYLVFGNITPTMIDVTGKNYEEIKQLCQYIRAGGMTSLGCGLRLLNDKGIEVNGIAIASDGGENSAPMFAKELEKLAKRMGDQPAVYFYQLPGDPDTLTESMRRAELDMQTFDLRGQYQSLDYYSLPNLVATMNTKRYGLLEQVMDTPLKSLQQVFN